MPTHAEALRSLSWEPDKPTTVRVIDIKSGVIINCKTNPFMFMHHINSFETREKGDDVIVVDYVTYPDVSFLASLKMRILLNKHLRDTIQPNSQIRRFRINLRTGKITVEVPFTRPGYGFVSRLDLPIVNENYRGGSIAYVYGIVAKSDGHDVTNASLVKKDLTGKGRDLAWFKSNHYPSEPWFVPKPHSQSEDDGLLLSLVLNGRRRKSYIAVFDPRTMRLINHSRLPTAIPITIHGHFYP